MTRHATYWACQPREAGGVGPCKCVDRGAAAVQEWDAWRAWRKWRRGR